MLASKTVYSMCDLTSGQMLYRNGSAIEPNGSIPKKSGMTTTEAAAIDLVKRFRFSINKNIEVVQLRNFSWTQTIVDRLSAIDVGYVEMVITPHTVP